MKHKILLLITGCIITVTALTCIQAYFIFNTYLLKAKEANAVITQQFLAMETSGKLDDLNKSWIRKTGRFVKDYMDKKVAREDYEGIMKSTTDSLTKIAIRSINKKKFYEDFDVSYANYLSAIVVYEKGSKVGDTIYSGKMLVFGNNVEGSEESKASQSRSRDDSYNSYSYEIISDRFYGIANWRKQIIVKMSGLLVFSTALLIFVVLLFYWSIKNLITQKKIADIKTDFINNITHEFQTPLAALDIAVATLKKKEGELTPEQFNYTLSIVDRQNLRMQKLFNQVTRASLATDAIDITNAQTIGYTEIQEIINDFIISHPDTTINFEEENKNRSLYIDRFHLDTIVVNLLDNAVKYGATTITVSLRKEAKNTILQVQDNGIGIAQKEQLAIFDKFYRVQKGDVHTTKGLGLGLFYVQQIIAAYKGTISVTSEIGQGATFIISIPQP
ncbi:Sensor protein SrrB [compost metagenome]